MNRKNLLAKVHIGKKELALDDETYRQALNVATGKQTCAEMTLSELEQVITHFKSLGWKPKKQNRQYSPKTRNKDSHDIVDKIRALWIDMYQRGVTQVGTEAALDTWVKRTTSRLNLGIGVDRVEWLRGRHKSHATKVLETLKQWNARVVRDWQNADMRLVHLEQKRQDEPQDKVVQSLLDSKHIFWWPLFDFIGIPNADHYCQNRRELNNA